MKIIPFMLTVFALVLTAAGIASAQLEFKPAVGLTLSDISKDPDSGKVSGRPGYQIGASVLIGQASYVEAGVFYTRKSTEITETSTNVKFDNNFTGIRIPVMAGFKLIGAESNTFGLRVFGGGSAYWITSVDIPGASKDDFTSPTYGVFLGAGADIFILFVDLKYEWSLSDVSKLSNVELGKSRSFLGNVGVRLPL